MKPRPFYRWKSFWLGLCVLLSLGWAWSHSMKAWSGISWQIGKSSGEILQEDGQVLIGGSDDEFSSYVFDSWSEAEPTIGPWFPPMVEWFDLDELGWNAGVAHWSLILLFLILWLGWLFFHWKREQRRSS